MESKAANEGRSQECASTQEWLWARRDGELSAEGVARLEAHLTACGACRREAEREAGMAAALRRSPVGEHVLPTGAQAVAWIQERERARPVIAFPWRVWAPAAALAAAVVVLVAPMLRQAGPESSGGTAPVVAPTAVAALPVLVVVDDERTGRQVMVAPAPAQP